MKKPIKKLLFAPLFTSLAMLAATACTENEQTTTSVKSTSEPSTNNKNQSGDQLDKSKNTEINKETASDSTSESDVKKENKPDSKVEMNQMHSPDANQISESSSEGDKKNKAAAGHDQSGGTVTHDGTADAGKKGEQGAVTKDESTEHMTKGEVSGMDEHSETKTPTPKKEGVFMTPSTGEDSVGSNDAEEHTADSHPQNLNYLLNKYEI